MLDLTGGNLTNYIIRIARDVVSHNPRFRQSLGTVSMVSNNGVSFGDVQVLVKGIQSQGNRLSSDYFMCTQKGRALVAKVADKEGNFVEWLAEIGNNAAAYVPGVFYMNIDSLDESNRQIGMTVGKYLWKQGNMVNAGGSKIYLADDVDTAGLILKDETQAILDFLTYPNFLQLLTPANRLSIHTAGGGTLTPGVDFWYERTISQILGTTLGGQQQMYIPNGYVNFQITDQDEYVLREGIDYQWNIGSEIDFPQWTPAGSVLTISGYNKVDPTNASPVDPENYLGITLLSGQTIANEQIVINATSGDYSTVHLLNDGYTLPILLSPGDSARWEVRVNCGQFKTFASKMELNSLLKWKTQPTGDTSLPVVTEILDGQTVKWIPDRDTNSALINIIPGVQVAIGDSVILGDQAAIIVNPNVTETYEVFGSKESVSFTLDVKANDNLTASDISELLKRELLVTRRNTMEADGVSILEVGRSSIGEQRDSSGTAARYIYSMAITALCDWKVYVPLVTRITNFEVVETAELPDFAGKVSMEPRVSAFGENRFDSTYRFVSSYA